MALIDTKDGESRPLAAGWGPQEPPEQTNSSFVLATLAPDTIIALVSDAGAPVFSTQADFVLTLPEMDATGVDIAGGKADEAAKPIYSLHGAATPHEGYAALPAIPPLLPALKEGAALSASAINGMFAEDLFVGDGSSTFLVSLIASLSFAQNGNSLGVYEVDAAGNIVDVRLLVNDASATPAAQAGIFGVEAGHELGFFLVSDGADWANGLGSTDVLSFIDSGGDPANLSDGSGISLAVNGAATDELVFHSLQSSLNPDGQTHVISGSLLGDARVIIGFEDLLNGGDRDYQDVVFQVDDALLF